ncbi:RNA polymerase subunit sigma [Campylobacter concisus]|uniref:RNA polymerase subunit sigma n=1 Tax=Campylobacter concisus TaxID=199 RepID=UPI003D1ADD78
MNGEVFNSCIIVASIKQALKSNLELNYKSEKYIKSLVFDFILGDEPEKREQASINEWFKHALKLGLSDVRYATNLTVSSEERSLQGFSNVSYKSILCIYKDKMSYFVPHWSFEEDKKGWDIVYKEFSLNGMPEIQKFSDNTLEFKDLLTKIAKFADEIECDNFGDCFREGLKALNEPEKIEQNIINAPLMPKLNLALFNAASAADVFGGMGSWNDDAAGWAKRKKRDKEYDELSAELFTQMHKATLFAINEW